MKVVTRTFQSGNSEAVRLPKDIGFGVGVEVEMHREGDVVTLVRKRMTNRELVEALNALPKPSTIGKRPDFIAPFRKGL